MMTRFSNLLEPPRAAGVFDAPFSCSELRQALARQTPSRMPSSRWRSPGGKQLSYDCSTLSCNGPLSPHSGSSALLCPSTSMANPRCQAIIDPCRWHVAVSNIMEQVVHALIAVHISNQLHPISGGFRWGADAMVGSFVDVLQTRSSTHLYVAFVDRKKAFHTSWVEATLVLLYESGVTRQFWGLIAHFLRQAQFQVRLGALLSEAWEDRDIAQGRVLSPLLFDLLIDGLAHAVRE